MSKFTPRSKPPAITRHKDKTAPNPEQKIRRDVAIFVLVIILAGIPFAFGRYFEFSYPDPFDSAANVYSAQHILNGAKIGVDEKPSAALGTLLVNVLGVRLFGFNEFGPKFIQLLFQAIAFFIMFIAMRKAFGNLAAAVAVIVTSIYTSSPLIAKFGNVKEQFMIACMVTAVSLFVLRQMGGGWWYSLLAGAIVSWAPLFKETGASAIGGIGLFVILQPIFGHRTWKQTGLDIVLLLAGAVITMAPLYIWIIGWKVQTTLPYSFVWDAVAGLIPKTQEAPQAPTYVSSLRDTLTFAEQWPRVLRYYLMLILPVSLAVGSILLRIGRMIAGVLTKGQNADRSDYDRFVLLLGVWWILDMAFVWISPASYEQYYLPLTASGAMTGAYLIAVYSDKFTSTVFKTKWVVTNTSPRSMECRPVTSTVFKTKWVVTGIVGFISMVVMSWHVFFGISKSPYSAMKYPERQRGYVQRWVEISHRKNQGWRGSWEVAGEYIRDRTQPTDKIYVWGWVPGIYLSAQRFSSAPIAFESEMHARPPEQLEQIIDELLAAFNKEMPKYIVDSRKQHLPLDRLKFELWPIVPEGFMGFQKTQFLPSDPQTVAGFEKLWGQLTMERSGENEARRFEIMGKFRKFIRENYERDKMFGECVVFKLKAVPTAAGKMN